jgi:hypothetical protein
MARGQMGQGVAAGAVAAVVVVVVDLGLVAQLVLARRLQLQLQLQRLPTPTVTGMLVGLAGSLVVHQCHHPLRCPAQEWVRAPYVRHQWTCPRRHHLPPRPQCRARPRVGQSLPLSCSLPPVART